MYCGGNVVVREAIQTASGGSVANWIKLANASRESGNHQEVVGYCNKVLEVDPRNYEAWLLKGEGAAWMSTLANCRLSEMLADVRNAIESAPPELKEDVARRGGISILDCAVGFYNLARNHLTEYISVAKTWPDHVARCAVVLSALEAAHAYAPKSKEIIQSVINICISNVEGVAYTGKNSHGDNDYRVATVTPEYAELLREKIRVYTTTMRQIDPTFQPPVIQPAQHPLLLRPVCFVATATMGNENHPTVLLLREFRESWLQRTPVGRNFIKYYCILGPALAQIIERSRGLRLVSYFLLVKPAAYFASHFVAKGGQRS
jgi:hypothetical protein